MSDTYVWRYHHDSQSFQMGLMNDDPTDPFPLVRWMGPPESTDRDKLCFSMLEALRRYIGHRKAQILELERHAQMLEAQEEQK